MPSQKWNQIKTGISIIVLFNHKECELVSILLHRIVKIKEIKVVFVLHIIILVFSVN